MGDHPLRDKGSRHFSPLPLSVRFPKRQMAVAPAPVPGAARGSSFKGTLPPMRIAFLAAMLAILAAAPSGAWQVVEGRVVQSMSGEPLTGATVTVQVAAPLALARVAATAAVTADAQGRFQVDLPRAMPAIPWDRVEAVTFVTSAQGMRPRADRVRRARLGRPLELGLEPPGAALQMTAENRARLDALRSPGGATIFVVADGEQGQGAEIRDLVTAELARAVRQHASSFVLGSPTPDFVVKSLDLASLGIDAGMPAARLAESLNALMIVSARIDTVVPPRGRAVHTLASTVHLGETGAGLPASYGFDDAAALDGAGAVAEFERVLAPRWARLAILGWGVRELAAASRAGDMQRLRALQQLLVHELRASGRATGDFVLQLQALQRAAEDAIRRIGPR